MNLQLLQIYFQSGDFSFPDGQSSWWKDLLINAFGAFIGVIGALALYYWQVWVQQKDKLKYVSSLLESIINYSKTQATNCKTLSEKIDQEPTKLHLLQFQANHDLQRLANKVDQESFYHAYLAKYKRNKSSYKSFKNLYGYIDFIDQTIDELKSFLEKEYLSITERKKKFAEYLSLGLQKSALLLINPRLQNQQQLLHFINQSIQGFYNNQTDVEDLTYALNSFVIPVKNYLAQNFPNTPECNDIMITLKGATSFYSAIELQSKALAEDLLLFHNSLNSKADELSTSTDKLRKNFNNGM